MLTLKHTTLPNAGTASKLPTQVDHTFSSLKNNKNSKQLVLITSVQLYYYLGKEYLQFKMICFAKERQIQVTADYNNWGFLLAAIFTVGINQLLERSFQKELQVLK